MSLLSANDIPVARAEISIPRVGRGVADMVLASGSGPSPGEPVVLRWQDGYEMRYTCLAAQRWRGWWHMRLVAGTGRLNKLLPNRYYEGIAAETVARDILNEAGERLGKIDLPGVLTRYVRRAGPAYQQLAALLSGYPRMWRVLPDGGVWIGEDAGGSSEPVAITEVSPAERKYTIELSPGLLPGVVLRGIVDGVTIDLGTVERVRHIVGPQLRTEVWSAY